MVLPDVMHEMRWRVVQPDRDPGAPHEPVARPAVDPVGTVDILRSTY